MAISSAQEEPGSDLGDKKSASADRIVGTCTKRTGPESDHSSLCVSLALLQNYNRLNEIKLLAGCFQFFSSPLKPQGFAAAFPVLVEEFFQVASSMAQTQVLTNTHHQTHSKWFSDVIHTPVDCR